MRKKPSLAPLSVSGDLSSSFSLSDTGSFAKEGFSVGSHGITESPRFSQQQVSDLRLESCELGAVIGRGASSRVYVAVHRPSGRRLALKVLQADIEQSAELRRMVINEIKVVYDACSDHLVSFYDAFFNNGAIHLALEYMDCGSLEGLLRAVARHNGGSQMLEEGVLAAILYQSLQGLIYLHRERHAVHRDLKPANILLDSSGFVKLSDFGITKELGTGTFAQAGTQVGTLAYMSPERVRGEPYGLPSDVWSLGLIALEAASGAYPYPAARSVFEQGQVIVDGPLPTERPELQQCLSADLLSLVHACLQKAPGQRPGASDARSPFFARHLASRRSARVAPAGAAALVARGYGDGAARGRPAAAARVPAASAPTSAVLGGDGMICARAGWNVYLSLIYLSLLARGHVRPLSIPCTVRCV